MQSYPLCRCDNRPLQSTVPGLPEIGTAIPCTKYSRVSVDTGLNIGTSDVATLIKVDPNELALWKEVKVRLIVNCVDHIQYM